MAFFRGLSTIAVTSLLASASLADLALIESPSDDEQIPSLAYIQTDDTYFVGYNHEVLLTFDRPGGLAGSDGPMEVKVGLKYVDESAALGENLIAMDSIDPDIVLSNMISDDFSGAAQNTIAVDIPIHQYVDEGYFALAVIIEPVNEYYLAEDIPEAYVLDETPEELNRRVYYQEQFIQVIQPDRPNLRVLESQLAGNHGNSLLKSDINLNESTPSLRQNLSLATDGLPIVNSVNVRHTLEIPGQGTFRLHVSDVQAKGRVELDDDLSLHPHCESISSDIEPEACNLVEPNQSFGMALTLALSQDVIQALNTVSTDSLIWLRTEADPDKELDEWRDMTDDNRFVNPILFIAD